MTRLLTPPFARLRQLDRGLLVLVALFALALPLWTPRLYSVDSVEYFSYLPSWLFDHDVDFTNEYRYFDQANPNAGIAKALLDREDKRGMRPINVAPIGTALLWLPAFVLAHIVTLVRQISGANVVANGLSQPYIWAVCAASLVYGMGGMLLSYHIARRWVGVWAAAVGSIACWLATPVVFYSYISPPWSHAPALCATALFVWYWLRMRAAPTTGQWVMLGALGGLVTLCREQLGLWLLLPGLDALVAYVGAVRHGNWRRLPRMFGQHALFALTLALTLVPQLLIYRALTGHLRPSSDVQGKLRWYSPHFFDTLVDGGYKFQHGAFLWTPVWLLGVLGLLWLWRRDRRIALALWLAVVAQVYVNGMLDTTWHLSGSFGFRRLIEATPVFVVGVALLVEQLRRVKPVVAVVCALLIAWNVGLIAQWSLPPRPIRDGLVWDGMLRRQLAVPVQALQVLQQGKCAFVENGGCR